jgi:hypothetical protein
MSKYFYKDFEQFIKDLRHEINKKPSGGDQIHAQKIKKLVRSSLPMLKKAKEVCKGFELYFGNEKTEEECAKEIREKL